jgi:hypothetical protein
MSVADDYGRYYAHPSILRAHCFPVLLDRYSEADVKQMISECEAKGVLSVYGGGKYLVVHKFRQQTRSPSKFPEPSETELLSKCKADDKPMCSLVGVGVGVGSGDGVGNGTSALLPFESEAFRETWELWRKHRTEIRKPLKPTATNQQLTKLKEMGEQRAIAAIKHSIGNGWTGIFEPTGAAGGKPTVSRNAGTYNEGKSSQYANAAK